MTGYLEKVKSEVETLCGCPVEIVRDDSRGVPCTIEYAAVYARDRHVVRISEAAGGTDYSAFAILLFTKLQLVRMEDGRMATTLPVTQDDEAQRFYDSIKSDKMIAVVRQQIPSSKFDGFIAAMRNGLVTQAANQVLEMLVMDEVVREYPEAVGDMKVFVKKAALEGAKVSRQEMLGMFPAALVEKNRVMNICFAMNAGERCGERLIDAYKPTEVEIDAALDLYGVYQKERDAMRQNDRIAPDVVAAIFKNLGLDRFAHLELRPITAKPVGPVSDDGLTEAERKSTEEFKKNYGDADAADAAIMTLLMTRIIEELESWQLNEIKSLALEIATLGMSGLSPKKSYPLKAFPSRGPIPGREVLAYYYVSWAIVFPDKLEILGLPFKGSYESAMNLVKAKKESR